MVRYRVNPARVTLDDLLRGLRCGVPYAERVLAGEILLAPLTARILAMHMGIEHTHVHVIATRVDVAPPPSPSDRAAAQAESVLREAAEQGVA